MNERLLVEGFKLHQAGRLAEAEQRYRQLLENDPHQTDALHLLGLAHHQRRDYAQAAALIRQAIATKPDFAEAHLNLAKSLQGAGDLAEAAQACRKAIELKPDYAEAHNSLGAILRDHGRLEEAAECHRRALALKPDSPAFHNSLGVVLKLHADLAGAIGEYERAIALDPHFADAYSNLGNALRLQDRMAEAAAAHRKALSLKPGSAELHINLGIVLTEQGAFDEGFAAFGKAVDLAPDSPKAHMNYAMALMDQNRTEDAIAEFDKSLAIDPDYAEARTGRGEALLRIGEFARGWEDYEWRFLRKEWPGPPRLSGLGLPQPEWDGTPFPGKTLLVYDEQGFGDTLQFVRYLKLARARGGYVVFVCDTPLAKLLLGVDGADQIMSKGEAQKRDVPFDLHIPLMSLPRVLGTELASIPADIPYLKPDPALATHWRARLAELAPENTLKVGLVWGCSPKSRIGRRRSCPLALMAPLLGLDRVAFFSLQKGPEAREIGELAGPARVIDFGADFDEANGAFMDTAAVMTGLDLVISVDTSVAHLAGALGKEVWVLLPWAAEWRWMVGRDDTPWYPNMRLFRQDAPGDWQGPIARMRDALLGPSK